MALRSELFRCGSEEKEAIHDRSKRLNQGIGRTGRVGMPFEVVGLIHDKEIESCGSRLFGPGRVFGQEFGGAEDELAVQEWISGLIVGFKGSTTLFVEEGKEEIETAQQFHEPLVDKWLWNKNEDPVSTSGKMQTVKDEAGFNGLSQSDFVGEEKPGRESPGGFRGDGDLVWNEIDAGTREAPGGRAANATIMLQGLGPEVKGTEVVALTGEEALFRLEETQGVEEMLLRNLVFPGVVYVKPIPVLNPFNGERFARLVLDPVTLLEVDADQGSGGEDILAHFFSSREANLDPVTLRGDDEAQAEFRLGCTGPSLTGEGVLHGRESGGRWPWRQE